jgi:hypothetical protein
MLVFNKNKKAASWGEAAGEILGIQKSESLHSRNALLIEEIIGEG